MPQLPSIDSESLENFKLPEQIQSKIRFNNEQYDTVVDEVRTQKIYTDYCKYKLGLHIPISLLPSMQILDICAGTGFLSYHLLKISSIRQLHLLDISSSELEHAKSLLNVNFQNTEFTYTVSDAINTGYPNDYFDLVIGNSFLHHFYDLHPFIVELRRIIKPEGKFISLHEPTPVSYVWENASLRKLIQFLLKGNIFIEHYRVKNEDTDLKKLVDVWFFTPAEVEYLFRKAGFTNIKITYHGIFRPFFLALFRIHLNSTKQKHNKLEIVILKLGAMLDLIACNILQKKWSGSIAISAQ